MDDDFKGPRTDDGGPQAEAAMELRLVKELSGLTFEEIMQAGKKDLVVLLVARCRLGTASAAEMGVLRAMLKDNGMTLGIPPEHLPGNAEPVELPEYGTPSYNH